MSRLHLVYGESGAAMLRLTLSDLGRGQERVAVFPEILQYAPLFSDFSHNAVCEYTKRCTVMGVVGDKDSGQLANAIVEFLQMDFSAYDEVVLWQGETAGDRLFGYMVSALVGRDLSVVDLTPLRGLLPNPHVAALSMAHCSGENLKQLICDITPLAESKKSANAELWDKWSKSMSDLRLLSGGGEIVEAYRQIFDEVILSACSSEWQPAARVVAQVLCQIDFSVGDSFLHHRMVELARSGKISVQPSDRFSDEQENSTEPIMVGGVDVTELRRFDVKS